MSRPFGANIGEVFCTQGVALDWVCRAPSGLIFTSLRETFRVFRGSLSSAPICVHLRHLRFFPPMSRPFGANVFPKISSPCSMCLRVSFSPVIRVYPC
jgi:hypothetical protein